MAAFHSILLCSAVAATCCTERDALTPAPKPMCVDKQVVASDATSSNDGASASSVGGRYQPNSCDPKRLTPFRPTDHSWGGQRYPPGNWWAAYASNDFVVGVHTYDRWGSYGLTVTEHKLVKYNWQGDELRIESQESWSGSHASGTFIKDQESYFGCLDRVCWGLRECSTTLCWDWYETGPNGVYVSDPATVQPPSKSGHFGAYARLDVAMQSGTVLLVPNNSAPIHHATPLGPSPEEVMLYALATSNGDIVDQWRLDAKPKDWETIRAGMVDPTQFFPAITGIVPDGRGGATLVGNCDAWHWSCSFVAQVEPGGVWKWLKPTSWLGQASAPPAQRARWLDAVQLDGHTVGLLAFGAGKVGPADEPEAYVHGLALLDDVGSILRLEALPGLGPTNRDGAHGWFGEKGDFLMGARLDTKHDGQLLVVRRMGYFVPGRHTPSTHGMEVLAIGPGLNVEWTMRLPHDPNLGIRIDPVLVRSEPCGLTFLWTGGLYRTTPWGHASEDAAGACATMPADACRDDDPCTTDICDRKAGCLHVSLPEGSYCGAASTCKAGACKPLPTGG